MIEGLNTQTALLEAFSWDEEVLKGFNEFISDQLQIAQAPTILLEAVRASYGESAELIIKSLFTQIYIEHGLYLKPMEDKDEH